MGRDWNAVDAHFRNSAGPMKDRRESRGGGKNETRDALEEADAEQEMFQYTCSWCGVKFGKSEIPDSHGMCPECFDKEYPDAGEDMFQSAENPGVFVVGDDVESPKRVVCTGLGCEIHFAYRCPNCEMGYESQADEVVPGLVPSQFLIQCGCGESRSPILVDENV